MLIYTNMTADTMTSKTQAIETATTIKDDLQAKKLQEAKERQQRHRDLVTELVAKYAEGADPLSLKLAKIRDSIYNLILNDTNEKAKEEVKAGRQLVNKDAIDKARAAKKNGEKVEAVLPAYKYSFKYSDETKASLKLALEKNKQDNREKYVKEKMKAWSKEVKEEFAEFKRTATKDAPEKERDELLAEFDSSFFIGFHNTIKIIIPGKKDDQGKAVRRVETFAKHSEMPEQLRYKFYLSVLTRSNSRFNKESQIYIAIFVENVLKQIITNALANAVRAEKKSVDVEHIRLTDDREFLSKYVPLAEFIQNTKTYLNLAELEAQTKVKKSRSKKAAAEEPVAEVVAPVEPAEQTTLDKVVKVFTLSDYITKQLGNPIRVVLATDGAEDVESAFYRVNFSSAFKTFCYNLMAEIVFKIGNVLQLNITSFSTKTINHNTVFTTITSLLISLNTNPEDVLELIQSLQKTYTEYLESRKNKRGEGSESAGEEENEDELA